MSKAHQTQQHRPLVWPERIQVVWGKHAHKPIYASQWESHDLFLQKWHRSAAEMYNAGGPSRRQCRINALESQQVMKTNDCHETGLKVCNTCRNAKSCLNCGSQISLFRKPSSNRRNTGRRIYRKKSINACDRKRDFQISFREGFLRHLNPQLLVNCSI